MRGRGPGGDYREMLVDLDTPVSAYLKVVGTEPGFLLESVENGERTARYTFLGMGSRARLTYQDGVATLTRQDAVLREWPCPDPLTALRAFLGPADLKKDGLPPFCGGAVGYLGFETAGCFERLPKGPPAERGVPDALFLLADPVLAFDHVLRTVKVISTISPDEPGGVEGSYHAAVARIQEVCSRLAQPWPRPEQPAGPGNSPAAVSNVGKDRHMEAVRRAVEYIHAGDAIQVVVSQRLSRPLAVDSFTLYRALRTVSPSPYMVYLNFGEFALVGASVETLLKVTGKHLYYHPIAGTRRRGASPDEDAALEKELKSDEKERAEHIMLVD